jgi:cytokinin dehydrogenase
MRVLRRREFLEAAGATIAIGAFDPLSRTWIAKAHAHDTCGAIEIPRLEGELSVDTGAISEASVDFGHIVTKSPRAVLRTSSEEDIARVVRFANRHRIKVAMRGQAHAVYGQASAECGIAIDSRFFDAIHEVTPAKVVVDAGVRWSTVLAATLAEGLTPPVLTDYIELSVGGVLSVGGLGGAVNRFGWVADNVSEVEVVTGDGRRLVANRDSNRDLFHSVLGGLGQFGIILKATLDLVPAPAFARIYDLVYPDLGEFLADQRRLATDARFDFLQGQLVPTASGGFAFAIQAGAWYTPPAMPDDAALIGDLAHAGATFTDFPYFVWLNRVSFAEAALRELGLWDTPHPWSDLFVPDRHVESYMTSVLSTLTPADLGAGLALFFPFRRARVRAPFVRVPFDRLVWAFDVLRFPFFPTTAEVARLLAQNRALYDEVAAIGGKRYAVGALDFSSRDWIEHFGISYVPFLAQKLRYDPRNVLTPGQGIFE